MRTKSELSIYWVHKTRAEGPNDMVRSIEELRPTSHACNRHDCAPCQYPSQALHFALAITIQFYSDFLIELLNFTVPCLLLHAHRHLPIVQHPTKIILQRQTVLGGFL